MSGGMGEWLKPTDLKSVKAVTSSGVRIPLPPPSFFMNLNTYLLSLFKKIFIDYRLD